MKKNYDEFLETKKIKYKSSGFKVESVNEKLFDFQGDMVMWALGKGKAALFTSTGSGKTAMQLEWAKHVAEYTGSNVLILAPLAVAQQTVREGIKFDVEVHLCRTQDDVKPGVNITNYEMLHHFDTRSFAGIVIDESGILKSFTGKVRNQIIESFIDTPFRLACTAVPAPNDHMELGNHSEFLGVMTRTEMLSTFFVHDGGETSKWRLKGHAVGEFWQWVSSWAVMMSNPADLGYDGSMFDLPPLNIHEIVVDKTGYKIKEAQTLIERRDARRDSMPNRVACAAEIANSIDDSCLIWCDLNIESDKLTKSIGGAVEVKGSQDAEYKTEKLLGFAEGSVKKLVSKAKITGFGMNYQICNKMVFVGISDSFEAYYQAVRRCWRFGQTRPVDVYIITSEKEGAVVKNIKRKEKEFNKMLKGMIAATQEITKENIQQLTHVTDTYETEDVISDNWEMHMGDNVESIKSIDNDSIHFICYSPPFSSLFVFGNSDRDMSNCRTNKQFIEHFSYLIDDLYRVLMPGRLMSVHCMNLPTTKNRDGVIGLTDFRGELIKLFVDAGFIFHSEVVIWKDPVVAMQRTKALGLLHKQTKKDSCMSRQAIPDTVINMRKPGDNPERVTHTNENFPVDVWKNYASPVWMDIKPSDTLQRASAREHEDERHIAPLQLEVIRRVLELWTNPGDTVLDPFAGIGSTGYEAVKFERKFIGLELKKSYFEQAVKNLINADKELLKPKQIGLEVFE